MENSLYTFASIAFVTMAFVLLLLIIYGLNYAIKKTGSSPIILYIFVGIISTWLILTGLLAASGFYSNFNTVPPKIMMLFMVPLISLIIILNLKKTGDLLRMIPAQWMVYIQSFRILMEIILWMCFLANVIPVQMSFEGRNWDILVGLTAPFAGYFLLVKNYNKRLAIYWNIFGLILLFNIVTVALFSTPFPFRYFMNEPANTFIVEVPFVWLPAFVVPVAFFMHGLSLKQLLLK